MKKTFFTIWTVLMPFFVLADEVERVFLSTDRNCYVAGDEIALSLFCVDAASDSGTLSAMSRTAYVELQSSTGTVQTAKIALHNGRGAGSMTLFPDLPTGNYALIAYTAQNLHEKGYVPTPKFVSVYNVLTVGRVPQGVIIGQESASDTIVLPPAEVSAPPVTLSAEDRYDISSQETIRLTSQMAEEMTLSLSVYHEDSLCKVQNSPIESITAPWKGISASIDDSFYPEYEGEVIRLKVSGDMKPGRFLCVSFPGPSSDCYFTQIDPDGYVTLFTRNIPGDRDMVCEPFPLDTTVAYEIQMEDPFLRPAPPAIPPLVMDPSIAKRLTLRGVAMQLAHRFSADTMALSLPAHERIRLNHPDKTYLLDDYTRFPLMKEVLVEYVSEMVVRRHRKHETIKVIVEDAMGTPYLEELPSMIFLDGMPVLDHDKFLRYAPKLIQVLEVFKQTFVEGRFVYSGAANFKTYRGDLKGWPLADNVKVFHFNGVSVPTMSTRFPASGENPASDYRQTLYWNPLLSLPAGHSQSISIRTPCYKGRFRIVAEGITASGRTFSTSRCFECR